MILSETAEQREEALLRRFRIVTKLTAINFIRFDFSENRKVIRKAKSDNASRLWYTFIVVNSVKIP